ncbi:hypothetical protein [Nonomuraea sp. NPDC048901]|uniref:hypothetical protein n=1 Tax=Nonomuraea sp. NPDC048901 TaxID=3155627 RepID=UPI0033E00812
MEIIMDCVSPHVAAPKRDVHRLDWLPAWSGGRVRVIAWTCSCRDTIYELCYVSSRAFIRRTTTQAKTEALETHPLPLDEAGAVWVSLVSGRAL